jgi:hypothetical protein
VLNSVPNFPRLGKSFHVEAAGGIGPLLILGSGLDASLRVVTEEGGLVSFDFHSLGTFGSVCSGV